MSDNITTTEQVSWNMSSSLLLEIGKYISASSRHYMNGHIEKAFYSMKVVKMRIIQSLKKKERIELKKMEKEFHRLLNLRKYYSTLRTNTDGEKQNRNLNQSKYYQDAVDTFENYNEFIMDTLETYGYLIQRKEDRSKMPI